MVKTEFPAADTRQATRFRRALIGKKQRRKVTTMMLLALLVPFGLLAVLLGMERLERWTVGDSDDS